jgi:formate dehydrogenase iron-sulfur subunit
MMIRIAQDSLAIACGADDVAAAFVQAGAKVTRTSSYGLHWLEPLVELNGQAYAHVAPDMVADILGGKVQSLGAIADHSFLKTQTRLIFERAGITQPLSLEDYAAHGGWHGLHKARAMGAAAIVDCVTHSGLRGRGGAGFPTGIKWRTVMETQGANKTIVCNADEGDSGNFADRAVMEGDPYLLIEGMAIAGLAVGADKGIIYVRSEYPHSIAILQEAARLAAPHIAPFSVEIFVGAGAYVCGEETSLLNSLEGKRAEVRAKPPLPAHEGLHGAPTVINNVLTLASVPWILAHGAEAYAALGCGRARGTMPFQLSGNLKHTGLYEAPFGLEMGKLLLEIGGGTRSGTPIKAVQIGGPLGAYHPESDFHLSLDYETLAAANGLLGHGSLVVFDSSADMAAQARYAFAFCAHESCGKCTPCRIGSTRGVELIDAVVAGRDTVAIAHNAAPEQPVTSSTQAHEKHFALIEDLCETMQDGSLCALGGFTPYPVRSAIKHWPEDFGPKALSHKE